MGRNYSRRGRRGITAEDTLRYINRVRWKYTNLICLAAGLVAAYFIFSMNSFDFMVFELSSTAYLGILLSGIFYAFSVTTVPATVVFYKLGSSFSPLMIAGIGAFGTMAGDYLIFRFVKSKLMGELRMLTDEVGDKIFFRNSVFYHIFPFFNLLMSKNFRMAIHKIGKSKAWRTAMIVMAGAVIMLPIPDEIGVAMMGAVKFKTKHFLIMSYVMNFVGIFIIAWMGGA